MLVAGLPHHVWLGNGVRVKDLPMQISQRVQLVIQIRYIDKEICLVSCTSYIVTLLTIDNACLFFVTHEFSLMSSNALSDPSSCLLDCTTGRAERRNLRLCSGGEKRSSSNGARGSGTRILPRDGKMSRPSAWHGPTLY